MIYTIIICIIIISKNIVNTTPTGRPKVLKSWVRHWATGGTQLTADTYYHGTTLLQRIYQYYVVLGCYYSILRPWVLL